MLLYEEDVMLDKLLKLLKLKEAFEVLLDKDKILLEKDPNNVPNNATLLLNSFTNIGIVTVLLTLFKKEWRLVFSTVYLNHKVFLLDRCPNCNKPLPPFIWRNLKTIHFHCPHCKYEYKDATEYAENIPKNSKVSYYQKNFIR